MTINYQSRNVLQDAESFAASGNLDAVYEKLRSLALADFCNLHIDSLAQYPELSKLLPQMPADDVQKKWVGDYGKNLMMRSCNLARLFDLMSFRVTGSGLHGKNILDYGCGWGRLLRIMNYYSPMDQVDGVDPMQESLDHCRNDSIQNNLSLISTRPEQFPITDKLYDFAFAFSVFTHTPADVTSSVLRALRPAMSKNSCFVATIRSVEWVAVRDGHWAEEDTKKMRDDFYENGYAFKTFKNNSSLEHQDYGDTIMSVEYLDQLAQKEGWRVELVDRDLTEPFQIAVALVPSVQ
ncbi:MAG: class I SAM-dependent methyltransferase [Granulosicoccaceae bacterium]